MVLHWGRVLSRLQILVKGGKDVTNTLAYYSKELLTTVKSFILRAHGESVIKNRVIK